MSIKQHILDKTTAIINPNSTLLDRHYALIELLCGLENENDGITYGALDILIFPAIYHFFHNLLIDQEFQKRRSSSVSSKCIYYLVVGIHHALDTPQFLLITAISTVIAPLSVLIDLLLSNCPISIQFCLLIDYNPFNTTVHLIKNCIEAQNPILILFLIPELLLYTLQVIALPLSVVRNIFTMELETVHLFNSDSYLVDRIQQFQDMIFGKEYGYYRPSDVEQKYRKLGLFDGFPIPGLLYLPRVVLLTAMDTNASSIKRIAAGILTILLLPLEAVRVVLCTATFVALLPLVLLTHGTQKIASAVGGFFSPQANKGPQSTSYSGLGL